MAAGNKGWVLVQRPVGDDFDAALKLRDLPIPDPGPGQVLVKTLYLSLDPAARGWMAGPTYIPAVPLDGPMWGPVVGRVEKSNSPKFAVGDIVSGIGAWSQYCAMSDSQSQKLPDLGGMSIAAFQSLFGGAGGTAYVGLLDIGKPEAGETLVVSGAAGSVGSLVGQLGKIHGCRVIGIAGSPEKCAWLTGELGFDHAIDYQREDVEARLRELCPNGVDIYFENVGGAVGNAVIANLAFRGRVVLCGLVSQYNADGKAEGLDLLPLLMQRGTVQGFILLDHLDRMAEAGTAMARWAAEGRIRFRSDVVDGIENAVSAFRKLFTPGAPHMGKLMVRVDPSAG